MKFENINIGAERKRVLIAPLDWGLGHATRCIPIIYALTELNFEVIIAADGPIKNLLEREFKNVVFTQIKGYNIKYSTNKFLLPLKLLLQFPKLLRVVFNEHFWLDKKIREYKIDAVISDNRLGLYSSKVPCIYITHQLQIKTGNSFTEWLAQKFHYFFINKYSACWVPDTAAENNLAGDLSHPKKLPKTPVKYLGPLSRFKKTTVEKKYDLLILLSGPEPQRTIFENLLLQELKNFSGKVAMVKGLPKNSVEEEFVYDDENKITVANHLSATSLNKAIQQSEIVICRSGYTSVMDLIRLRQKAILVATPGQTEQEYLAEYLMEKKRFFSVEQNKFSLQHALQKASGFSFANTFIFPDDYKKIIEEFAGKLK
jgi:uncharacterized protein (TIGR00661 family)